MSSPFQPQINPALPANNVSNTPVAPVVSADASSKFTLFGPISKKFCWWFYLLEVGCMVLFLLCILAIVIILFYGKKTELILSLAFSGILYLAMYLQNRLLHNMCIQSI